jgi:hypothetical protein
MLAKQCGQLQRLAIPPAQLSIFVYKLFVFAGGS